MISEITFLWLEAKIGKPIPRKNIPEQLMSILRIREEKILGRLKQIEPGIYYDEVNKYGVNTNRFWNG